MPISFKNSLCGFSFLIFTASSAFALTETEKQVNQAYQELALFGRVFDHIRDTYVEEVTDEELINAAIDGMLRSLDPHSSFLTGEEALEMQEQTTGSYGGLGIQVSQDENGMVLVIAPFDDTPASKAGIEPGDRISHVDGEATMGEGLDKATEKMKGEAGTDVTLTIIRDGMKPFDVILTRAIIRPDPVRWRLEGSSGYIRLAAFNERTTEVLLEAIGDLQKQAIEKNKKINGYILDLRSNPGGLLDQAISVVDTFIDSGEIVSIRGRIEEETQRFTATEGDVIEGLPLIVLLNPGSASASEVVAGALQDLERAIIIGERSFGKGSVQTVSQVSSDGDLVRMTTARYFTPSGRSIQGEGIYPDIEVKPAKIEVVDREIIREGDIPGALSNPDVGYPREGGEDNNQNQKETTEEPVTEKVDPQKDTSENKENEAANKPISEKKDGSLMRTIKDAIIKKEEPVKGNKVSEEITAKEIEAAERDNQLQRALDLLEAIAVYNRFDKNNQKPSLPEAEANNTTAVNDIEG